MPDALKSYVEAPARVQKPFDKQVRLLTANLRHPSLRAKKYNESGDIWQARVNHDRRFSIAGDTYIIRDIIPPKVIGCATGSVGYPRIGFTTFPCTSVNRKCRPWNLNVSRV